MTMYSIKKYVGESAIYFDNAEDLKTKLEIIEKEHNNYLKLKEDTYNRVKERYSWVNVVNSYETFLDNVNSNGISSEAETKSLINTNEQMENK